MIVQRCAHIGTMGVNNDANCVIVFGGIEFLNEREARADVRRWLDNHRDADFVELDARMTEGYDFDEAVSPSLLSERAGVLLTHLEDADESLGKALVAYVRDSAGDPNASGVVMRHAGGAKGRRLVDELRRAGAAMQQVDDLKALKEKGGVRNFAIGEFERRGRRVEPQAAEQLAAVYGEHGFGELCAMVGQLCMDFDEDPITLEQVNRYMIGNPQVTGFNVADAALAGDGAQAVVMLRSALVQGVDPIALVGALAMKLRSLAKASAVRAGSITAAEAKMQPWLIRKTQRQLAGWSSQALGRCVRRLAWADEQCKTNGGDAAYAIERCVELIANKGVE